MWYSIPLFIKASSHSATGWIISLAVLATLLLLLKCHVPRQSYILGLLAVGSFPDLVSSRTRIFLALHQYHFLPWRHRNKAKIQSGCQILHMAGTKDSPRSSHRFWCPVLSMLQLHFLSTVQVVQAHLGTSQPESGLDRFQAFFAAHYFFSMFASNFLNKSYGWHLWSVFARRYSHEYDQLPPNSG